MRAIGQIGTRWRCITPRTWNGLINTWVAILRPGRQNNFFEMPFLIRRREIELGIVRPRRARFKISIGPIYPAGLKLEQQDQFTGPHIVGPVLFHPASKNESNASTSECFNRSNHIRKAFARLCKPPVAENKHGDCKDRKISETGPIRDVSLKENSAITSD